MRFFRPRWPCKTVFFTPVEPAQLYFFVPGQKPGQKSSQKPGQKSGPKPGQISGGREGIFSSVYGIRCWAYNIVWKRNKYLQNISKNMYVKNKHEILRKILQGSSTTVLKTFQKVPPHMLQTYPRKSPKSHPKFPESCQKTETITYVYIYIYIHTHSFSRAIRIWGQHMPNFRARREKT